MLGNCEKMEWPQIDETTGVMGSSGTMMEKPAGPEQSLKCPRCDSSNTKFCYYNNYSLSQPRHFCKACKRYWTRGGTLRNVPVGGGCRKNKKFRRPAVSAADSTAPSLLPTHIPTPHINPLFYGLPNDHSDINHHPFPQLSAHGLSYPLANDENYGVGGYNCSTQIQDVPPSNFSLFGAPSSTTTPKSTVSLISRPTSHLQALFPFYDQGMMMKEVKMEDRRDNNNPMEPIGSSGSSFYWNPTSVGAWPDLTNYGSSVTSLI